MHCLAEGCRIQSRCSRLLLLLVHQGSRPDHQGSEILKILKYFHSGPAGRGGAPPRHVPQPGQHRQEAGQWAGQPGGRHAPPEETGGDEHEVELSQSKKHGHKVLWEELFCLSPLSFEKCDKNVIFSVTLQSSSLLFT